MFVVVFCHGIRFFLRIRLLIHLNTVDNSQEIRDYFTICARRKLRHKFVDSLKLPESDLFRLTQDIQSFFIDKTCDYLSMPSGHLHQKNQPLEKLNKHAVSNKLHSII